MLNGNVLTPTPQSDPNQPQFCVITMADEKLGVVDVSIEQLRDGIKTAVQEAHANADVSAITSAFGNPVEALPPGQKVICLSVNVSSLAENNKEAIREHIVTVGSVPHCKVFLMACYDTNNADKASELKRDLEDELKKDSAMSQCLVSSMGYFHAIDLHDEASRSAACTAIVSAAIQTGLVSKDAVVELRTTGSSSSSTAKTTRALADGSVGSVGSVGSSDLLILDDPQHARTAAAQLARSVESDSASKLTFMGLLRAIRDFFVGLFHYCWPSKGKGVDTSDYRPEPHSASSSGGNVDDEASSSDSYQSALSMYSEIGEDEDDQPKCGLLSSCLACFTSRPKSHTAFDDADDADDAENAPPLSRHDQPLKPGDSIF